MLNYKDIATGDEHFDPTLDALRLWHHRDQGAGYRMPRRHRHNTVELNFILSGSLTYLRVGQLVRMPARRLVLFWGALPHQIIQSEPYTEFYTIHLPLKWFLRSGLPERKVTRILHGDIAPEGVEERAEADLLMLREWEADLADGDEARRDLVLAEARARLQRLALSLPAEATWLATEDGSAVPTELHKVERMAAYVSGNYLENLRVTDVAASVELHPKYATQLFRRICGLSLKEYITLNRVYHAQLLLVTTNDSILEVALKSGFGSESRFYATFRSQCGESPRAYRAKTRGPQ